LQNQGNPLQHDAAYGTGLLIRGNMTRALRWDVNYETDIGHATASTVGYNTCGSVIFSRDALGHQTTISYADSFSTNGIDTTIPPGLTLAYPTSVTINDPAAISSTAKYHYDLGTVTRQQDPKGAAQLTEYDSAGRVKRITNAVNGAYTRFVYPSSQTIVNKFTTIKDLATETYTATVYDGAGRVRAVAGDFPNSAGHYSGQFMLYDINGQAIKQTTPTEMTYQWEAAGDDLAGWRSSSQTFDWNRRPLVTTNTDGTTNTASYGGCGCAGGAVVTLTDEGTVVSGVEKKRQQKIYSDPLGRTVKTEVLNWDGAGPFGTGGSVYSTVANIYDARDQVTSVRQYQGTEASGVYQETSMTYDGYGRLKTKHVPQQNAGTFTGWNYFADDTIQTVTDARGASAIYSYNNRHLMTQIAYSAPAGITATPTVSFSYDAAGNRLSMTDGIGNVGYAYDQLSRMTTETRTIDGVGSFPLAYAYSVGGQLTKITDPTNVSINYGYDLAGRVSTVTGSDTLYGGVSNYASNFQYRAWGELKQNSFGDSSQHSVSVAYTSRSQVSQYEITHTSPYSSVTFGGQYEYGPDERLSSSTEIEDHRHDRAYVYDQAGRLAQALTGAEARGEAPAPGWDPFKQNYSFSAWGNLTSRTGHHWGNNQPAFSAAFVNNRNTNSQWQYSPDGDLLQQTNGQITRHYDFDAAGRQVSVTEPPRRPNQPTLTITERFDGDGKRVAYMQNNAARYEIRSSVLGTRVITELNAQGAKTKGWVYANGGKLARQSLNEVAWVHEAPDGSGEWQSAGIIYRSLALDPSKDDVGVDNPYAVGGDGLGSYPNNGDPTDFQMGCAVDGSPMPCSSMGFFIKIASQIQQIGAGVKVPIHEWKLNPGEEPGDWCTDGICPPEPVTVHDMGGHFEVAGYNTISNTPAMRRMQPPLILPVNHPIGNEGLKTHVEHALSYSDCAQALDTLLAKLGEITGVAPSQTSFRGLLNAITSQTAGGGLYADIPGTTNAIINQYVPPAARLSGNDIAGGGGLSWVFYTPHGRQRISTVFLLSTPPNAARLSVDRIPFAYVGRAIHELFHNAPNDSTRLFRLYEHEEMNAAAAALGARDFDQYVREHCIPRKYW
jgi:YD repeat-containing protein